jgi:hypothetical protein
MIRLLITFFVLSSCSNIPISYKDLPSTVYRAAVGYPEIIIDQEAYNENRFSFATVAIGKSKPIIMVLLSIDKDTYTWVDKEGGQLITRNGRIIQTVGLPHDIEIKFETTRKTYQEGKFSEIVNFNNPLLINADLSSFTTLEDKIDYLYLDELILVNVYSEEVSISDIGWKKENKYFMDINNREIKTIQFVHPFMKEIKMEFYYK